MKPKESLWYDVGYKTAKKETVDRILEIIDEESTRNGMNLKQTAEIRRRVVELKGGAE